MRNPRISVAAICVLILGLTVLAPWGEAKDTGASAGIDKLAETRRLLKQAVAAIDAGSYQTALAGLDSVRTFDATNADSFYYSSIALLRSGDSSGAEQALAEGARVAPLSSRIKLLLARLKLASGEALLAGESIDAVLAIKPRSGEALYLRGLVDLHLGDTAGAVASFEKALEIALPEGKQ